MVELQIISKILDSRETTLITQNNIELDCFKAYREEIDFIFQHQKTYGNVPDKETFIAEFEDFDFVEVLEGDRFLLEKLVEEYTFRNSVEIINEAAEILQKNSHEAVRHLLSSLPKLTQTRLPIGTDIIGAAKGRLDRHLELKSRKDSAFIQTGFQELDDIIGGFGKGEELVALFARTGVGKTFVLLKMLEHSWKMGLRVGLVEPEMSSDSIGYRFDSLNKHFSNFYLSRGKNVEGYEDYISELQNNSNPFFVATPRDFGRKITTGKLESFVRANNLDILAIDGITYLADERATRGDNKNTALTNISEDLMDLSIKLKIPIIVIVQSNRAIDKDGEPELENIRDSDGIAHNSSLVISLQQKEENLILTLKKSRFTKTGTRLKYSWDIDTGKFTFLSIPEDSQKGRRNSRTNEEEF